MLALRMRGRGAARNKRRKRKRPKKKEEKSKRRMGKWKARGSVGKERGTEPNKRQECGRREARRDIRKER